MGSKALLSKCNPLSSVSQHDTVLSALKSEM